MVYTWVQALSGAAQIRVEAVYDEYRKLHLSPLSNERQIEVLSRTQKALTEYKKKANLSLPVTETISYLDHLFCQTKSLITGYFCEDNYYTPSPLTTLKDKLTLTQIRTLLTEEHSKRRALRGLSALIKSDALDNIAQSYAYELCEAGEITHTLNGSTLQNRYENGDYDYSWWGENLGLGQENIMELLDQLTTSIYHRENMYQAEFRELWIGQCDNIWVLNYGAK